MQTILVVEDDPAVAEGIRKTLEYEGFEVMSAHDGTSALQKMALQQPDLILADVMMPGMNGYQLYQRVRRNSEWVWIPFIFLTARAEDEDIRYGKEMGVDDYLTKPIEPEDLVAAVWGRLTRYAQLEADSKPRAQEKPAGQYQVGKLRVDFARRQVFVVEQETKLSPTEFDILQHLIMAEGAVVLYEDLLGYDQGQPLGDTDAAELLRYHMRNLRRKLRQAGQENDLIINVRSAGYRLATTPQPL